MLIRPIEETDFDRVEELITKTILEVNAKDYSDSLIKVMLQGDPVRPRDSSHDREYFVAIDETLCGIIGLKENEIKTFFVDPVYRGKGIGTQLLSFIENIAKSHGYEETEVYSSITSRSFYEKNGYIVVGTDPLPVGDEILLRYFMQKDI
jgi:GNAT superfamily N-acetyltransferase